MPTGYVPQLGSAMGHSHVVSAAPVQGIDWSSAAAAYDFVDGMGSMLIPTCAPMASVPGTVPEDLDGLSLWFTVYPRYQATHRLWLFSLDTNGSTINMGFGDNSGGTTFTAVSDARIVTHVETLVVRSGAEQTFQVFFATDADALLTSVACIEIPRGQLAVGGTGHSTSDAAIDASFIAAGLPLADDTAGIGAGFIPREMDALRDNARRTGLFSIAPFATTTSASWQRAMVSQPIVLGRCLYRGQTQSTMQFAVRATLASGATGKVRITMASGASQTYSIPSSGLIRGQIQIDCEDLSTSDGRRGARDETVTIEYRSTNGGSVTLASANGGEGAASSSPTPTADSIASKRRMFGKGPIPKFMGGRRHRR